MEYLIKSSINQTWKLFSLAGFVALFILTFYLSIFSDVPSSTSLHTFITSAAAPYSTALPPSTATATAPGPEIHLSITPSKVSRKCRMYEGKWVYKPEENPGYNVKECPFVEEKMSCGVNGRPDLQYENWEWQSNDCNIPLFDGKKMMRKLRGKRVIIVGDSLNKNMWESLACLLYTSISNPNRTLVQDNGTYKLFKAKDYKFSLEFYWAPFLVHFDKMHKSGKTVVVLDSLGPLSVRWRGADVMVFNTGHWWTHNGKTKSWDLFQYKDKLVQEMETEVAYEWALSIWAKWIRQNVDPTKTKVFFRSISPEHKSKDSCLNANNPIMDESYTQLFPRFMINIVEEKIRELDGQVRYLNITKLSSYRKDAHPSIYIFKKWKSMEKQELLWSFDCSHWCLPGLPDTWNRILYASLFSDHLIPGDLTGSS